MFRDKPKVCMIVAHSKNMCIGKDNKLPWSQKTDLCRFKSLTEGSTVIMGSNTIRSLGKPLPNRVNLVVTSNNNVEEGFIRVKSLSKAIRKARKMRGVDKVWVIGGASIYEQALQKDYIDEIYVTEVLTDVEDGDTFIDNIPPFSWVRTKRDFFLKRGGDDYNMVFYKYVRGISLGRANISK